MFPVEHFRGKNKSNTKTFPVEHFYALALLGIANN